MNIKQKIGQMLIAGFEGTSLSEELKEIILSYHAGGIILFSRNIESIEQVASLNQKLQHLAKNSSTKIPLFISIDQEGGRVSRLTAPFTSFPPCAAIGASGSEKLAKAYGKILGKELFAIGINMNFSPVLDINTNPDNPVIGDRAFGTTAEVVSMMGCEAINGMRAYGVIAVGKHFPGHGDTSVDSHFDLPVVNSDYTSLMETELKPFAAAVDNGIDAIMTAHILYPKIDESCATTSEKILQNILRKDIGFNGLIISDDMEMNAVSGNCDIGDMSVKAVKAGVDIVMVCKSYENIKRVFIALEKAVCSGVIPEQRIDESVNRIISLKERYHLDIRVIDIRNAQYVVGSDSHTIIADKIRRFTS